MNKKTKLLIITAVCVVISFLDFIVGIATFAASPFLNTTFAAVAIVWIIIFYSEASSVENENERFYYGFVNDEFVGRPHKVYIRHKKDNTTAIVGHYKTQEDAVAEINKLNHLDKQV